MGTEPGDVRFDRKMSDTEALMWRLEHDPLLTSTFANVTILDRPPDLDRLRRRLERAVHLVPRLRQRVQPAPVHLVPPSWVDDPDFDLGFHLRHLALPPPGSHRQLLDLVALLVADPWDRARPLWTFVVVEGLDGGRAALVQKMHHTVIDGEGGVLLSLQYLDAERDAAEPPAIDGAALDAAVAQPPPSPAAAVREVAGEAGRLPLAALGQLRELVTHPGRLPGAGLAAAGTLRAAVAQLTDTERARSPLWTARSLRRRIETLRVPFRDAKDTARTLGGTVNTLFVAAAADAAGAYHRRLGAPVEELRASMAISTRTASSGANAFSLARVSVPTGPMDPVERFRRIQAAADAARHEPNLASLDVLAAFTTLLPTALVTHLARQQTRTVDFATSNVRGAPFPMYIAGAQLLENYPVGPLVGVAFNLTLLSYHGSLDMGLNVDPAAVAEPGLLRDELRAAFDRLLAAR